MSFIKATLLLELILLSISNAALQLDMNNPKGGNKGGSRALQGKHEKVGKSEKEVKSEKGGKSGKGLKSVGARKYYVELGEYGEFTLETSADGSTMDWNSNLTNLRTLPDISNATSLTYHLHTKWNRTDLCATSGETCGSEFTGGHHDPYFRCSPASSVSMEECLAIGRTRDRNNSTYACSGAYEMSAYDKCEVGDLSGKYGPLAIGDGKAEKVAVGDPLPVLNVNYEASRSNVDDPSKFASVVFHGTGGARVLCGKLIQME